MTVEQAINWIDFYEKSLVKLSEGDYSNDNGLLSCVHLKVDKVIPCERGASIFMKSVVFVFEESDVPGIQPKYLYDTIIGKP